MNFPDIGFVYSTSFGQQVAGDSRPVLAKLPDDCIDLIVTSPPFALLRQKSYGNENQSEYVEWLLEFGRAALPKLKYNGSFVVDLGGAYERGRPVRSLYNFRILIQFCDVLGYRLAEEFFWHNPSKLPSPIEWVNKRKIRVKDSVNTIWWFAKSDWPKANVSNILAPYSERMKTLLKDAKKFYTPKLRPSGHDISESFSKDNGGAIPANLLQIPNTGSTSGYMSLCREHGFDSHPARFPEALPEFFIRFLTDPGDMVVDLFSGSNTTGWAAESLGRRWLSIELDNDYAIASSLRFMQDWDVARRCTAIADMRSGRSLELDGVSPNLRLSLEENSVDSDESTPESLFDKQTSEVESRGRAPTAARTSPTGR
jgi:site-specific DNA-methyltransferase (cytosine-N4-specific)